MSVAVRARRLRAPHFLDPSGYARHRPDARLLYQLIERPIDQCARCGGKLKILASIEAPAVIAKILAPLERSASVPYQPELPLGARAPPERVRLV